MTSGRAVLFLFLWSAGAVACNVRPDVLGQPLPERALKADPADFAVDPQTAALHYYGAGGWGIAWRKSYVLLAPFFSNHTLGWAPSASVLPKSDAIRDGFAGTPVRRTDLILVGHGHYDHAGDIRGYFEGGHIETPPGLVADLSTVNLLAALSARFRCRAALQQSDHGKAVSDCVASDVRVTPLHSAHAPHIGKGGLEIAAFGGRQAEPMTGHPTRADEFKIGYVWAFLVDLMDGPRVAFRIHYMDAAGSPPHGMVPQEVLAERPVDLHLACAPGYDVVDEYPEAIIDQTGARYVMAGHWENFFLPRSGLLTPVPFALDGRKLDTFVRRVVAAMGADRSRGVAPENKTPQRCNTASPCGPRGNTWTLPIPGETFRFRVEGAARLLAEPR